MKTIPIALALLPDGFRRIGLPAQELQILQNPQDPKLSPWYRLGTGTSAIQTPEWLFQTRDFRRFD